jgi:hypothetical protein
MLDDDIRNVVHGHLQWWKHQEPEQELFEDAYETLFWSRQQFRAGQFERVVNPNGMDEELPVKLEANRLWKWVNTHTSHLFLRAPRTSARAPGVTGARGRGRPKNQSGELAALVEALADEWLNRTDVQNQCTHAYQLALMGGASAFKLGVDKGKGHILDRLWLRVCPRWECVWDDRASNPQEQLFRGHLSWLPDFQAERLLGPLPDKWARASLPGLYTDDVRTNRTGGEEQLHPERYVRVLEFYDFEEGLQKFFLVDSGATEGPNLQPYGKPAKMPYTLPSGEPACPIFPVVLDNTPKWPMRGIPSARRVYRLAAEDNLLGSMVASRVRRSFAALGSFDPNQLDDDFGEAWRQARDLKLVKRKGGGDPASAVHWFQSPPIDPSLDKAKAWIDQARLDTEATSPQMGGGQGNYLTAKEAELMSAGGEATTLQIASRMVSALSRVTEMALVVIAAAEPSVTVSRGAVEGKLTREQLRLPWHLTINDAGTTPSREAARKKEWGLVMPMLKDLVDLTSPPPPPPGQPPVSTEAMKRFAMRAIDMTVQIFDLPDVLSSSSLLLEDEDAAESTEEVDMAGLEQDLMAALMPQPTGLPAMDSGVPALPAAPPAMPTPPPAAAPVMPAAPPLPASTSVEVDPVTGMAFDELTGVPVDPMTGVPITPMGSA